MCIMHRMACKLCILVLKWCAKISRIEQMLICKPHDKLEAHESDIVVREWGS